MKNRFTNINTILLVLVFLVMNVAVNAQKRVGINNDNPQATLDIKSDDTNEVLRVTQPSVVSDDNLENRNYVFFAGVPVMENGAIVGYDLRKVNLDRIISKFSVDVPSNNSITITNSREASYLPRKGNNDRDRNKNRKVELDRLVNNSNEKMFEFVPNNKSVKFNESGYYNITAFVGFEKIGNSEDDILISVAKKDKGVTGSDMATQNSLGFVNFKRNVISRTSNGSTYEVGTGVGGSFSFVSFFEEGEELCLVVNKIFTPYELKILPEGASLTVSRISKGSTKIK